MKTNIKIALIETANRREALVTVLGEKLLIDLEEKFGGTNNCYVRIQNSMEHCIVAHFNKFIQGYIYGKEENN